MKNTDKKNKNQTDKDNKTLVDKQKMKFLGITKELSTDIEPVDAEAITGGKKTDPTVITQWPTSNL